MDLSRIKSVEIAGSAIGRVSKFIIAEVSSDRASKTILRSSDANYHNEIAQALIHQLKDFDVRAKGGGKLYLDPGSKRIWIWGRSSAFGAPDHRKVRSLLKETYRDFELTFEEYHNDKQPL